MSHRTAEDPHDEELLAAIARGDLESFHDFYLRHAGRVIACAPRPHPRQARTRVNPDQREAIEMAFFQGLTYEETARRLALPLGTLKSRIRLGLKAMREELESAVFTCGPAVAMR